MLSLEGLSMEAKIGKILIFIGIILGIITIIGISFVYPVFGFLFPSNIAYLALLVSVIRIIGIIIAIYAFFSAERGEFRNAGILAIISAFIPPLDIIILIGGILCLIAPEAGRTKT